MWRWLRPGYTSGHDGRRDEEGEPPCRFSGWTTWGVVDDLEAAIAFFVELGMELEGEAPIEGRWVDRVVGLDGVRVDIAMMRTPDGHGRLELTKFHTPTRSALSRRTHREHAGPR
jgi:Glyoxalase/Bleomycin resistance protein/Dioxygenase superfamily